MGDTIAFTFELAHAPTSDGSPVILLTTSDDIAGPGAYVSGDDDGDGALDAAETWTFTRSYTVQATDPDSLVNTVTASGVDPEGDTISAQDSHTTDLGFAPVLAVTKSGPATASVGDTVTYSFAVTHGASSDGSPVGTVAVDDDVAGAAAYVSGDDGDGLLEAGETWVFQVAHTIAADETDPLVNTATASGTDSDGDTVTATDDHTLDVLHEPALVIAKSGPATASVGDTVTYTFEVSHAASSDGSPLVGVAVSDNVTGAAVYDSGDTDGDDLLDAGETWTFTDSRLVGADDPDPLVNTATVAATDRDGETVTDADTHSLAIDFAPTLEITKSGPATASVGDTVTYTFEVAHGAGSDGSPVAGLTVVDDVTAAPLYQSGDADGDGLLDGGETWIFTVDHLIDGSSDPLVNTATASGTDRDGEAVSATDDHTLDLDLAPVLVVTKTARRPRPSVTP